MRTAYVSKGAPRVVPFTRVGRRPRVGVRTWSSALQCDRVHWEGAPPDEVKDYDAFLVNVFLQGQPVTQIKDRNPDAIVVAVPDPHLERFMGHVPMTALGQLRHADVVGGRTPWDCQVLSKLLDRPVAWMPSPIGPMAAYDALRIEKKPSDTIITTNHRSDLKDVAQNVAVVAELQRITGMRVDYYKVTLETRRLAVLAGLEATYYDSVPFKEFIYAVMDARVGVDMYAAHAMHRHALAHAAVATVLIKSNTTNYTNTLECDPFATDVAVDLAMSVLTNDDYYDYVAMNALSYVRRKYSFTACRERFETEVRRVRTRSG